MSSSARRSGGDSVGRARRPSGAALDPLPEAVLQCMPEGVAVFALDGALVWANDTARRLLGELAGGAPAAGTAEAGGCGDAEQGKRALLAGEGLPVGRALAGELIEDETVVLAPGDRGPVWLRVSAAPLSEGGRVAGAVLTLRDVSRLHELTERRVRVTRLGDALNSLADLIHATLDPEKALPEALGVAARALGSDGGAICMRSGGGWRVHALHGIWGATRGDAELADELLPDGAAAARTRDVVAIQDTRAREGRGAPDDQDQTVLAGAGRAVIAAPLIVQDDVIGLLYLGFRMPMAFEEPEKDFVRRLASSLSLALENARLYAAEGAARKRLEHELKVSGFLLSAGRALAMSRGLEETVCTLADIAVRLTGFRRAIIALAAPLAKELTVVASRGECALPVGTLMSYEKLHPAYAKTIEEGAISVVDYDAPGTERRHRDRARRLRLRQVLVVPLLAEGVPLGFMTIDDPGVARGFDQRTIDLAGGLAAQAGVAIRQAQLYEAQTRSAGLGAALNEISAALSVSLDPDTSMGAVLSRATEALGAKGAVVAARTDGGWRVRHAHGLTARQLERFVPEGQEGMFARLVARGGPVLLPDVSRAPKSVRAEARRASSRAVMAFPLQMRRRLFGALVFYFARPRRRFSDQDVEFALRVGLAVSQAEANAQLFEQEHRIAETLQQALLSPAEPVRGLDVGYAYVSATERARVGGDFYDVFELVEGQVTLVVGDVSGKGVEAAALTALLTHGVRAYAIEGWSPAGILAKMNEVVLRFSGEEMFATMFVGRLDLGTGRLIYASAGHPPPVALTPAGMRALKVRGPLLGAFEGAPFPEASTRLAPGQVVLLYTDGVVEARRQGRLFGVSRLARIARDHTDVSPKRLARTVLAEVVSWAGGALSDDAALLTARYRGRGP